MSSSEIGRPALGRPGPGEDGRKAILDAAARAFARNGYFATSIDAIADELGATKGRVYHYYRGKAEIFLDVVVTGMRDLIAAVEPIARQDAPPGERVYRMARVHASLMMLRNHAQRVSVQALEMRSVAEIAIHHEVLADVFALRRRYEQLFIDVVEEGVRLGDFAATDSGLVVKSVLGALNWIPIWYAPGRGRDDVEHVADTFARFIVNGLKGS
ncbi:TetR family transcriptional regulator [Nonomuraea sp. NPDC048826]|uniref:TetR family transcriptional regulator n=1 Tax=Nonomuraea sp. NPDC048826 TaxID=3364347 RepID=UPI003714B775